MNAPVRRLPLVLPRRTTKPDREPSDMAHELLERIIGGLARAVVLTAVEREVLYQFLFGRSPELVGRRMGLRETTVHKHLHRVYARTGTDSRRALLELGRDLAETRELVVQRPRLVLVRAA